MKTQNTKTTMWEIQEWKESEPAIKSGWVNTFIEWDDEGNSYPMHWESEETANEILNDHLSRIPNAGQTWDGEEWQESWRVVPVS